MNNLIRCLLLFIGLIHGSAHAAGMFVSDTIKEKLGGMQAAYEQAKFHQGLSLVEQTLKSKRLNKYEQALVYQMQGYLYAGDNQLEKAANSIEKALSIDALDTNVSNTLKYNLAQLWLSLERYKNASGLLEQWIVKQETPSADAYTLLATAYYFQQNLLQAEKQIIKAIALSETPRKTQLELALVIYIEQEKYFPAIDLLEKHLPQFPDDARLWKQLANLYRNTRQDKKAASTLYLAYEAKLLDEQDIVNLARLYFFLDAPYKGADLLSDALKKSLVENSADNLELLGQCWLAAREHTRAARAFGEAATLSNNADLYIKQAEIHLEQEQWQAAIDALEHTINLNDEKSRPRAWLLKGIALYERRDYENSLEALGQALKSKKIKQQAGEWIRLVKTELQTDAPGFR